MNDVRLNRIVSRIEDEILYLLYIDTKKMAE
jgi:hypothetical protein